jgi:hypothetical protein
MATSSARTAYVDSIGLEEILEKYIFSTMDFKVISSSLEYWVTGLGRCGRDGTGGLKQLVTAFSEGQLAVWGQI